MIELRIEKLNTVCIELSTNRVSATAFYRGCWYADHALKLFKNQVSTRICVCTDDNTFSRPVS